MKKHATQIQRIRQKFEEAKNVDKNLLVFGADGHKYKLGPTLTEKSILEIEEKYNINLPECYKAFVCNIGTIAGPFYGMHSFDDFFPSYHNNPERYLKGKCILYPKMTEKNWEKVAKKMMSAESVDMSDDEIDEELGRIYGGILPIGYEGCTYMYGIVLNGKHSGKIVHFEMNAEAPPVFSFEKNFLDWYERWLDEIISGDLLQKGLYSPFSYTMGGPEEGLLKKFLKSKDAEEKKDCLEGLLGKAKLKNETLNEIGKITKQGSHENQFLLTAILCGFNYKKAKPFLLELSKTDLLAFLKCLCWHKREKIKEWKSVIEESSQRIKNVQTFIFWASALRQSGAKNVDIFFCPFTRHENEDIRAAAFEELITAKNKNELLDIFIAGLYDTSEKVIEKSLNALWYVKNKKLLDHYKALAKKTSRKKIKIWKMLEQKLDENDLKEI